MKFFALVGFFFALIALIQIAGLKKEIAELKSQLGQKN